MGLFTQKKNKKNSSGGGQFETIQVKFGVPYFDVYDSIFLAFCIPVAVRGTVNVLINKSASLTDIPSKIRSTIITCVKMAVANAPSERKFPVVQIESKISEISNLIENNLSEKLFYDWGIRLMSLHISNIEIDKTSEEYRHLISKTK